MRAVLALAVAYIGYSAAASAPFECVLLDTKDADGQRVQFRYDAQALWDKPQWTPGGEGPQLSLEAATKIAIDAAKRQVPKSNGVSFENIKLLKNACDWPSGRVVTWFWVFSISPVIDEHPDQSTEPIVKAARDIVILLDGTVVEPKVIK